MVSAILLSILIPNRNVIDNIGVVNDLITKKKHLLKEMHLLESKLGNSKTRDISLHKDPFTDVEIVPPNSSYFDKSLKVQQIQDELHRKTFEEECFKAQNASNKSSPRHLYKPVQSNVPVDYPYKMFGGKSTTTKDSYANFHQNNKYGPVDCNKTFQNSQRFESNINDYNNLILQQNKLVQPPRHARKTLMLSNLGFQSHCSDIALEIVEILRQRNV